MLQYVTRTTEPKASLVHHLPQPALLIHLSNFLPLVGSKIIHGFSGQFVGFIISFSLFVSIHFLHEEKDLRGAWVAHSVKR